MRLPGDGSTNRALLTDVADWRNQPAWLRFRDTYDPLLARWCRGFGLDRDSIDEVRQRIWIELADRMKTFEYDPNGTFRGWLRQLCESRVLNFLRERRATPLLSLDERLPETTSVARHRPMSVDGPGECDHRLSDLLMERGEKVQSAVRARILPRTWDAFWLVAVCDWSVARTAESLGMTHVAVYAARDRVARMLCVEGKRVSDGWTAPR